MREGKQQPADRSVQATLGAEDILAKHRASPGMLVFTMGLDLLWANQEALVFNQQLIRAGPAPKDKGVVPPAILAFVEEVTRLLATETDPKAWETLHPQRVVRSRSMVLLLRGFGLPALRAAVVLIEGFGLGERAGGLGEVASHLTGREGTILSGLLGGLTNKEIGNHLELSEHTVKNHIKRLMKKTGARTRTGIVVRVGLNGQSGQYPHKGKTVPAVLHPLGIPHTHGST